MITYCYCDKCGKSVNHPLSDEDGVLLCKDCALELYNKIFYNNPRNSTGKN